METNQRELKPCPFCGGEVIIKQSHVVGMEPWIEHKGGGCVVEFSAFRLDGDLAEAWNTRASAPAVEAPREVVERVAKAIYEAYSSHPACQEWAKGLSFNQLKENEYQSEAARKVLEMARWEAEAAIAALQPSATQPDVVEGKIAQAKAEGRKEGK